jgi:hypothetical protein
MRSFVSMELGGIMRCSAMPPAKRSRLEVDVTGQLHLTLGVLADAVDGSEVNIANVGLRIVELRMVETLYACARNSNFRRSVISNPLKSEKSTLLRLRVPGRYTYRTS